MCISILSKIVIRQQEVTFSLLVVVIHQQEVTFSLLVAYQEVVPLLVSNKVLSNSFKMGITFQTMCQTGHLYWL